MKIFKRKETEVEVDETEVALLLDSFQSQIDQLTRERQNDVLALDKEAREVTLTLAIKKQNIIERYAERIDKYQQLITKIRRDKKKEQEEQQHEIDTN